MAELSESLEGHLTQTPPPTPTVYQVFQVKVDQVLPLVHTPLEYAVLEGMSVRVVKKVVKAL